MTAVFFMLRILSLQPGPSSFCELIACGCPDDTIEIIAKLFGHLNSFLRKALKGVTCFSSGSALS